MHNRRRCLQDYRDCMQGRPFSDKIQQCINHPLGWYLPLSKALIAGVQYIWSRLSLALVLMHHCSHESPPAPPPPPPPPAPPSSPPRPGGRRREALPVDRLAGVVSQFSALDRDASPLFAIMLWYFYSFHHEQHPVFTKPLVLGSYAFVAGPVASSWHLM